MNCLFDTDVCIFYMKGVFPLDQKFDELTVNQRYISEITLAELKFGVQNSQALLRNTQALQIFLAGVNILPILPTLDFYANEKARLRRLGTPVADFDLLIGSCAVTNNLRLITNNERHFHRITGITLENWVK